MGCQLLCKDSDLLDKLDGKMVGKYGSDKQLHIECIKHSE